MDEEIRWSSPERPKKRKLRYPRTSHACNFCRKRKVRCSGTQPCEVCQREEVRCEFASGVPNTTSAAEQHGRTLSTASSGTLERHPYAVNRSLADDNVSVKTVSEADELERRTSIDPPQTFTHGHHLGANAGISFLYGQWNKNQSQEQTATSSPDGVMKSSAPLISYGDIPQVDSETLSTLPQPTFTHEQIYGILDRYFDYISPTYRFLHHPTVKRWADSYVSQEKGLTAAQKAVVLLVCAQTLLHNPVNPGIKQPGKGDVALSTACSARAKDLLDKETGPPSLTSVQARINMCLYWMSTSRLNECRYCFSFAFSIATALGIHRRQSSRGCSVIESECAKRTFWSLYTLDGYLSVILGRPRLIRDEDIDQPFAENIADNDLTSSESIEALPRHGNLEAFIAHSKLAQLMAQGNDSLYPLQSLTTQQILERSSAMMQKLADWERELPEFLKPKQRTMTGQRGFERQNTILKGGLNHVQILASRRCILISFEDRGAHTPQQEAQARKLICNCVTAIIMILDTTQALIDSGQCYSGFWTTQYFALVAISTLYVLLIQGARGALPGPIESFLNVSKTFEKAKQCNEHIASLPPPGSQAERHYILLGHLRSKVEKTLARRKSPDATVQSSGVPTSVRKGNVSRSSTQQNATSLINLNRGLQSPQHGSDSFPGGIGKFTSTLDADVNVNQHGFNDMPMFSSMLTPTSSSDVNFGNLFDYGWESLDTIGASVMGQDTYNIGFT